MTVSLGLPHFRSVPPEASDAPAEAGLVDRYGRRAADLRLSVIDKCNLRCTYCMPANGLPWLPSVQLMSPSEIALLVRIGAEQLGITQLRLTGGEPLVRRDLEEIVGLLRAAHPELPVSLTTNGVCLVRRAQTLADAGLSRINISLDTLDADTFARLARRNRLADVLAGAEAAAKAGLMPLKINAVLMRGVNDREAPRLLAWALEQGFALRFIEQMPLDADRGWTREHMVTAAEIRRRLADRFRLDPHPAPRHGAPAQLWEVRETGRGGGAPLGTVGIIASVTEPFCADCTRTRITAEGRVRSCLFSHEETELLPLLRAGAPEEEIADLWRAAMWAKPRAHGMDHVGLDSPEYVQPDRSMSSIGG